MFLTLMLLACDLSPNLAAEGAPNMPAEVDPSLTSFTRQQLEQQVVVLTQQNRAILAKLQEFEQRVGRLEHTDTELAASIERVQVGGVDALAARVDAAEGEITALSASFRALDGAALVTRMGAVEGELSGLGVMDDDFDIDVLALSRAATQHGVVPVTDDSDSLITRLSVVEDDSDLLAARLSVVEDDIDAVLSRVAIVEDDFDSFQATFSVLSDDVDYLTQRVTVTELSTCKLDDAAHALFSTDLRPCGDQLCVVGGAAGHLVPWATWTQGTIAALEGDTCEP